MKELGAGDWSPNGEQGGKKGAAEQKAIPWEEVAGGMLGAARCGGNVPGTVPYSFVGRRRAN